MGLRVQGNEVAAGQDEIDIVDEALDLVPPVCQNLYRKNAFTTDNEGDGPKKGCIR